MNESIGIELLLSTYKKVMSLHKQYDDASDVIDDAINALTRGPTLKDFIDFLDILKNVVRGHGLTVDGWIELMEESYSEEELKKIRILDAIHTLEWQDEAPCEKFWEEYNEKLNKKTIVIYFKDSHQEVSADVDAVHIGVTVGVDTLNKKDHRTITKETGERR